MTDEYKTAVIVYRVALRWMEGGIADRRYYEQTLDALLKVEQRETERRMREGER